MSDVCTEGPLESARSALFHVGYHARRLANATERLEAHYQDLGEPNPQYFYIASTMLTGREVEDVDSDSQLPRGERVVRETAVNCVLNLREAIDNAIEAVRATSPMMNSPSESAPRSWTNQTIGELRILRGDILRGHALDVYPSALPMIRAGVPAAIRDTACKVAARMEEVKTAIIAGAAETGAVSAAFESEREELRGDGKPRPHHREQIESPAIDTAPRPSGAGRDWRQVQLELLAKRERGEPYTSARKLAMELGCSDSTIRKAIKHSETLGGWAKRSMPGTPASARSLNDVILDTKPQSREANPLDQVSDEESDQIFRRLLDQASKEERLKLLALGPGDRELLALELRAQLRDQEASPLDESPHGKRADRMRPPRRA